MENNFANNIQEEKLNPWLSMWLKPRQTTRQVMNNTKESTMFLLAAAAGVSQILDRASQRNFGDHASIWLILIGAVLGGAIFGYIGLLISAGLIKWTGKWLGGEGTFEEIKTALAWSNVPIIWSLLLWIPEIIMFGNELFTTTTPKMEESMFLALAMVLYGIIELVIGIWAIVITCKCVGEVQGFSAWKAAWNLLLPGIIIVIPIIIFLLIIVILSF